jgi:hypothetical protein
MIPVPKISGQKLRDLARGQACLLRFPGCPGNSETVCLCHVRRANVAGMGQKPPDLFGVYGCDYCHAIFDGRTMLANLTKIEIDQYVLFALGRTLAIVSRHFGI